VTTTEVRLVIASPIDGDPDTGMVHASYMNGVIELLKSKNVAHMMLSSCDIVRARNRLLYRILDMEFSHILWWDEDVAPGPAVASIVNAMIAADKSIIGAAYPRKNLKGQIPIMHMAATLPEPENDCVPVAAMPAGFLLTRRDVLDHMMAHYDAADWYIDVLTDGSFRRSVGLFDLRHSYSKPAGFAGEWRERLSEDFSFCLRALECGIQPFMYVGQGTPLGHIGSHKFVARDVK
jgi:hypothetical protein